MAKAKDKEVVVAEQFAIMSPGMDIKSIITENLGADGITMHDLPRIKVPSGDSTMWIIPDIEAEGGQKALVSITGIIIFTQTIRTYWEKPFKDGSGDPPDCSSTDGIEGKGVPGGDCMSCPLNEFESHRDPDSGAKACSEKRLLFTATQDEILPIVIAAPATSLGNIRKFLVGLTSKRKAVYSVYAKLSLVTDKNKAGTEYPKIVVQKAGDVEDLVIAKAYADAIRPYIIGITKDYVAKGD